MRLHRAHPAALVGLLFACFTTANPYPRDHLRDVGFGYLMDRGCASYCGADNQYCCSSDETCVTSNNIATCKAGSGAYTAYTSTWTETHTYTSTWSSYIAGATTPASSGSNGEDCVPPEGSGQIACGTICCANWQYCAYSGQCSGSGTWTTGTTVGVVTTAFSAPYRVTGTGTGTTSVATGTAASVTATTTSTGAAVGTTTSNSLSGGAIAGIVVGTIAGVILLLLLCICCIIRGLWATVLAIFGIGKKDKRKTERTEIIEERYSRHGSAHGTAARPAHRTWFGGGGGRPSTAASRKEKKSSGVGWLAAAGGAALLLLGLRRGDKHKEGSQRPPRSNWSTSYYTDSYTASSPSSASSDRRTRQSRRSHGTRTSRRTSRHTRRS